MRVNWQTGRILGSGFTRWLKRLPYVVLIQRFMVVRLMLLVGLSLIALAVVTGLLYLDTDGVPDGREQRPLRLDTQLIDELEVWLEERQTEGEIPVIKDQREYFKQ